MAKKHDGKWKPSDLTDGFSRQYYHSLLERDFINDSIVVNVDFIPRPISTASLVVEGVAPGEDPTDIKMWGCLGYPPTAESKWVTLTEIPDDFMPSGSGWRSKACDEAFDLYRTAIPKNIGGDNPYIDMTILKPIIEIKKRK